MSSVNMSSEKCTCQKTFDFVPFSITEALTSVDEYQNNVVPVNFGKVEVGTKKWLKFPIHRNKKENIFTITRDPETNPIYQVFGFNKYKTKAQDDFLRVFYSPMFSQTINIDYFDVTDSYNNVTRVCVSGEGIGPDVQASTHFLKFHVVGDRKTCKHTVELKNNSDVVAQFSMESGDVFTLDKATGSIPGNGYVYVNITYTPRGYGMHAQSLECLVLHQEPVIIKLLGICADGDINEQSLLEYPESAALNTFAKYMADVQTCLEAFPLVSFSENYIDFGAVQCLAELESNKISKTMVTSLTNHGTNIITVQWETSPDDVFAIYPKSLEILSDESALFEATFKPDKMNNVYAKNIIGNVFWKSGGDNLHIPVQITLRLTGHTFVQNTYWIPQLEIEPEVSILPPALPGFPTYQTFLLKTRGHLPVLYKFQPPKKSNFIVKPAMGVVDGFKIVVVQLCTEAQSSKNGKIYVEQWCLQLNGQKTHKVPFYLKGFSERPKMVVGEENVVRFSAIQTGCMQKLIVPLRNKSQHYTKYELLITLDQLDIPDAFGYLAPNERKWIEWNYKSSGCECSIHRMQCKCYALEKMKAIRGEAVEVDIDVYVDSSYSELCSIPNSYDLGLVECHTQHTTKFMLRNFGKSIVNFTLVAQNADGKQNRDMTLMPVRGSIDPDGEITVNVLYTVETSGCHSVAVFYKIRTWEYSCKTISDYEKLVFKFTCQSSYPIVQVIDIASHDFGPLFTKPTLWQLMNIDRLNEVLRTIRKDESCQTELEIPEAELGRETFGAIFLLRNETIFPTELLLRRRQQCKCELQEIDESISFRKLRFHCPHRQILKLNTEEDAVEAKSIQTLHMKAKYSLTGTTRMSYDLFLSHNRRVQLDFKVTAITSYVNSASLYDLRHSIKLDDVCLSELDPCTRCFWLYNNSDKIIEHSLETISLDMINEDYGFKVLSCLNPSGEMTEYSSKPLIFSFKPIELRNINLCLPLNLGEERIYIRFSWAGKRAFIGRAKSSIFTPFTVLNDEVPITLSQDHIVIDPFPIWSYVTRLIFIRNMTKNRIIGCSWQKCKLDGVVEVKMSWQKAVLMPREAKSVVVHVKSLGRPCQTRLQVACKLLDHTQYYRHKKTLEAYNARQKELNEEFTITEDGTSYPVNEIEVFPCPKQFFVGVAIDVVITSVYDRDLHYTPMEQMRQSHHDRLEYEMESLVFKCVSNLEQDVNKPIKSHVLASMVDIETQMSKMVHVCEEQTPSETTEEEEDDTDFLEKTMECILGDVVFSDLFKEFLCMYKRGSILYYDQIKNKEEEDYERLAKQLYNDPQLDDISKVLREVVMDSMHQMFQLGPQVKADPDLGHLAKELEVNYEREFSDKVCHCHK